MPEASGHEASPLHVLTSEGSRCLGCSCEVDGACCEKEAGHRKPRQSGARQFINSSEEHGMVPSTPCPVQ